MTEPKITLNEPKPLNSDSVEEFYNKCHDDDGRFCGDEGPVSGKLKADSLNKETGVDVAKRYAEAFVGIPNQSSLKASKFSKINLRSFSSQDLIRFRSQFKTDAKNLQAARTTALFGLIQIPISIDIINRLPLAVFSASRSAVVLGFVEWRRHKINQQVKRINATLTSRKKRGATFDIEDFQIESDYEPSLIEEIRKAQKMIDEGKIEKVGPPTKAELASLTKFVNSLKVDPEDGITEEIIQSLKDVVGAVAKNTSSNVRLGDPKVANSARRIALATRVQDALQ